MNEVADNAAEAPIVLALRGITKQFGSLVANDAIDLELRRGEILALVGENGAGKTTLMNILFGHYVADAGEVLVAGPDGALVALEPGSPAAALGHGIGMVHQHFTLAENLTGLENIVLGTEPLLRPRLSTGPAAQARGADEELRADGRPRRAGVAAGGGREAARRDSQGALSRRAHPGDGRADRGADAAGGRGPVPDHPQARRPRPRGHLHRPQARRSAGRVGPHRGAARRPQGRRDGDARRRPAAHRRADGGRDVPASRRTPRAPGAPLLELRDVVVAGADARTSLHRASLTVHEGEIVGIAGVSGNGQAALAELVAGLARPASGDMRLYGAPVRRHDPRAFARAGIARIPEDRHHDGIVGAMTVAENVVIEEVREPAFQRGGF
jgi:general nucleoside transport system ATP-binding protein